MNDLETGNRYPALSIIVVVIKVFAALVGIIGVIAALLAIKGGFSLLPGIAILVGVIAAFIMLWATAESIAVMVDIEANTRASAIAAMKAPQDPVMRRVPAEDEQRLPTFRAS
jgi:hypothetical protein